MPRLDVMPANEAACTPGPYFLRSRRNYQTLLTLGLHSHHAAPAATAEGAIMIRKQKASTMESEKASHLSRHAIEFQLACFAA